MLLLQDSRRNSSLSFRDLEDKSNEVRDRMSDVEKKNEEIERLNQSNFRDTLY